MTQAMIDPLAAENMLPTYPYHMDTGNYYSREQRTEIARQYATDYAEWIKTAQRLGINSMTARRISVLATVLHTLDVAQCNRPMTDADRLLNNRTEGEVRVILIRLGATEWRFSYEPLAPPFYFRLPTHDRDIEPAYYNL